MLSLFSNRSSRLDSYRLESSCCVVSCFVVLILYSKIDWKIWLFSIELLQLFNIVIPSIEKAIETILKWLPLNTDAVWKLIDEMAKDIEEVLVSELINSKFSIQFDKSIFESSTILLACVKYFCISKSEIIFNFQQL